MSAQPAAAERIAKFFRDLNARRIDAVRRALSEGLPPSIQSGRHQSALTAAAEDGFLEGAKALIDAGANVNQRDHVSLSRKVGGAEREHRTALTSAIKSENLDMIELLLSAGADPRIVTAPGYTPAHGFIMSELLSTKASEATLKRALAVLGQLIAPDGVINMMNRNGKNLLHVATAAASETHPDAIGAVLARGADVEAMSHGERPIHREWEESDTWLLRRLVEHGADINGRNWRGNSVLCYAMDQAAAATMLELGADINHLNDLGRNALAASCDDAEGADMPSEVALYLIAAGIDTAHQDYTGASVESLIAESGRKDSERLLAAIQARKARETMVRVAKSAAPRPG